MQSQLPSVQAESLAVVAHQNQPVITTELLAQLYDTDAKNINQNFARNADRFVEGKHFFKLSGEALKSFVDLQPSFGGVQISSKTRHLTLWTERGAARHAKMLDTDQAWEVFEKLEDSYFVRKAEQPATPILPKTQSAIEGGLSLEHQDQLKAAINQRIEEQAPEHRAIAARVLWSGVANKFGVTRTADKKHPRYKSIPDAGFIEALSWVARINLTQDHIVLSVEALEGQLRLARQNERKALEGEHLPPEEKPCPSLTEIAKAFAELPLYTEGNLDGSHVKANLDMLKLGFEHLFYISQNPTFARLAQTMEQAWRYVSDLREQTRSGLRHLTFFDRSNFTAAQNAQFDRARQAVVQGRDLMVRV